MAHDDVGAHPDPDDASSAAWAAVVEADARLTAALVAVPDDELPELLRWALGDFASCRTALRVLSCGHPGLTSHVLIALEPLLLVSHTSLAECRRLVLRLPRDEQLDFLSHLTARVVGEAGSDDEAYRRLAELLRAAEASEPLAVLLDAASTSTDPDIREVAEGFA